MNKYYETVHEAVASLMKLAEKLDGPRVKKFSPREKRLIRLAVEIRLDQDLED